MKKISIALGLLLACIAPAQITKSGNGYLFRAKVAKGAMMKYAVDSTAAAAGPGSTMRFRLPMIWHIVEIVNGIATVDATLGPVTIGNGTKPAMQATRKRIQIDARNRVVGQTGTGQQLTPAFPEKPVKIGGSWSAAAPIELPMPGNNEIKATYTFTGLKTVNGKQMAALTVKTSGTASGQGSMLLLVSDGSLYRSNFKMNLKMKDANGAPMNYKVNASITRK